MMQPHPQNNTNTATKAAICGGASIFIICCLFFFGLPLFFAGIIFISNSDLNDSSTFVTVGVVLLVLAIILIIAGIVTVIYTVKYANRATRERQGQGGLVISTQQTTIMTQAGQPVQYIAPGQPVQYPQPDVKVQYPQQQAYPAAGTASYPSQPPPY